MNKKVKYHFSIPDSCFVWMFNILMLMAKQQHPEWFYDDYVVDTCYGCPPSCIWNGNREIFGDRFSMEEFEDILQKYQEFGITYRLTFTNFLLKDEHLRDEYGNAIAALVNKYHGTAIVSTELMYDFIKKNYPQLNITWSTTTDFGDVEADRLKKINELTAKEMLVIPYDMNNKPLIHKFAHPENIEILINEDCLDNCPRRREHETLTNVINLSGRSGRTDCLMKDYMHDKSIWTTKSMVSRDQLQRYFVLGIKYFKLCGRLAALQTFVAYLYYLVEENYHKDFLNFCESSYRQIMGIDFGFSSETYAGGKYLFLGDFTMDALLNGLNSFKNLLGER